MASLAPDLAVPHRPLRLLGGAGVASAIAALVALVLWTIGSTAAGTPGDLGSTIDIPHLLRMTVIQAGLTTALSLLVGIGLAWALNRLRFVGRSLVVALFAAAIVTPGIIVAFGLLTIWGRNGWLSQGLEALFGLSLGSSIFGLAGILTAHVILDGAFAARILLARLDAIPTARLKTGQSLALDAWQRFAVIDWPALRGALPGLAAIIFLLAFTSFPIVLLLGGGPANQTLEVAIYSAVRLDFDLRGAVTLALVQIAVCSVIILLSAALAPVPATPGPSGGQRWADGGAARLAQWLLLGLGILGFGLPLAVVLAGGASADLITVLSRPSVWAATLTSLGLGAVSAAVTLGAALWLALARAGSTSRAVRTALSAPAYVYLAVPAVVLALGFFLLARAMGLHSDVAAPVVVVIANALLSLPFAIATLAPPLDAIARGKGRLIRSLGLSGWQQWRLVEWPMLGREIGVVVALAFCFSLGDLGVIALFGTQDFATLPLLILRALGAYRSNDAAILSAILLAITIFAFAALPRLIESLADARA